DSGGRRCWSERGGTGLAQSGERNAAHRRGRVRPAGRFDRPFGSRRGPTPQPAVSAFRGECHVADELSRVWPANLDRRGSVPAVRLSDAPRGSSAGRTEVLRLLGTRYHPLPELRGAELRRASPVHLRLARQGRGVRVALPELLLFRAGLAGL